MTTFSMEMALLNQCTLFRNAIEKTDKARLPITFKDFPCGSCGEAVLLLGHYLVRKGFGEFDYMLGRLNSKTEDHSHAWLQRSRLIVDITADQFENFNVPVFVSSHSPWHKRLKGERQHVADFACFENTNNMAFFSNMRAAYSEILKQLRGE